MESIKDKEVLSITDEDMKITVYNTDQILIEAIMPISDSSDTVVPAIFKADYNMRNASGSWNIDLHGINTKGCMVVGAGFDLGMADCEDPFYKLFSNVRDPENAIFVRAKKLLAQNGIDPHKWMNKTKDRSSPKNYPELESIVSLFQKNYQVSEMEGKTPAIAYVSGILGGHGNIPPIMLLHPAVLWELFKGTIYPFTRTVCFDFEKGKKSLAHDDSLKEYDGDVMLIKPWDLSGDTKRSRVIEAHIFNPVRFNAERGNPYPRGNVNPLATTQDSVFEINYGVEGGREWLHFNTWKYAGLRDDLLKQSRNSTYILPDSGLVDRVEAIAPLFLR